MKLKFLGCLVDAEVDTSVRALIYSPNGRKLALATGEPHIELFDESGQRRDRFSTKPADPKYGKRSYVIRCLAFSPDSTRLAVGQSDNIVFVYRLGESWDEKKVICNKFSQSAAVSALLWPEETRLVIGLLDGKVRVGSAHSNKCATLYRLDAGVVALSQHPNQRSFVSGHEDGAIVIYSLESRSQTKVCVHSTAPYCLALCTSGILAAGADRRVVSYSADSGRVLQDFDFGNESDEDRGGGGGDDGGGGGSSGDFYVSIVDPTGHSVLFGSFNRMRLLCWSERRGAWIEDALLDLRNFYTVTALAWKPDGTTVVAGGSTGTVVRIDCCMRRALLKGRFETTYISPSQVFICDTRPDDDVGGDADGARRRSTSVLRSAKNYALTGLRVLGGRNGTRHFAVAHTSHTLIVADLYNGLCSEVPWQWSGSERFYFNSDNVCLVINAGEITFIEYGFDEALGWIRTERVNPHLVSVRVSGSGAVNTNSDASTQARRRMTPRGSSARNTGSNMRVCRVAYLLDVHTIAVVNLQNNAQLAHITHQNAIDWIELNESAQKLLFRDVGSSLYLHTFDAHDTRCLLGYCSYAQWVPRSDVVVAQSASHLCVWYNTDANAVDTVGNNTSSQQQNIVRVPIQGDVEAVLRDENRTEVIVVENSARVAYELDGAMIEFGTALNERDLSRALVFLERCESAQSAYKTALDTRQTVTATTTTATNADDPALAYELAPMWQRLADVALADGALLIAQRCYASLNDFPKVHFLQETIEIADWALQKDAAYRRDAQYETVDGLIEADSGGVLGGGGEDSGYASAASIAAYYQTRARLALLNKNFKRAEQIYLENGNTNAAIDVYRRLGQWEAALELAGSTNYERLNALKEEYYRMLDGTGQKERAAEMLAQEGKMRAALEIYLQSGRPAKAARLILHDTSRTLIADDELMQRVQDALLSQNEHDDAAQLFEATEQHDRAIEHYRRAKIFVKAVQVARRWRPDVVVAIEEEWADTLFNDGNFDAAINHYLESGQSLKASDAAIRAKEWERAIEILEAMLPQESDGSEVPKEMSRHYVEIARHFEADGEYEHAEKFYLASGRPADAVEMYNRAARWTNAYQLAAEHFGAEESRALYAQKAEALERVGRLTEAEQLYVGVGEPTRAIAMYKAADRREDVIRLVTLYHPDRTEEMHKRLAEECEERGDLKTAEEHYVAAQEWTSALEMYREAGQYADAFRVANAAASVNGVDDETAARAARVVAYTWAKSLGGDAAVKLLTRHGLLNDSIDVGITRGDFEFVFELCNLGAKTRLVEAQQKYAEHLEDEGNWTRAEEFYLKAGKGREAILMHVHNQNWQAAERLAAQQPGDALADVLIARGRVALSAGLVADAEIYFIRAARADLILAHYRDIGAWSDALRVAAKYAPDALPQLQHDYELAEASRGGAASAKIFVEQAANWERQGDYRRAVDCYLKVDERSAENAEIVIDAQTKAAELIAKFLAANEGLERVRDIGERLAVGGHNAAAADVFLLAKTPQRAVDELVKAREWTRARRIAGELPQTIAESLNEVIDAAHREYLREQGRVGELADVDASAAVDLLAERGDWDAALNAARQLNSRPLLDKYLLTRAGQLVDAGQYEDATRLFLRYGTSLAPTAFSVYKFIIDMSVNARGCGYDTYVTLRDMLADLNTKIAAANNENSTVDRRIAHIFQRYEFALHLYTLREALAPLCAPTRNEEEANFAATSVDASAAALRLRLQQSIALLRYVDLLQPDKVFFEAGDACREYGKEYESFGFMLLNHCLDIAEAIEENDAALVDNSAFDGTDVPQSYTIPNALYLTPNELEEVKEWVLATSVGRNVTKQLKIDERGTFEASTIDPPGNESARQRLVCAVSGYPILDESCVKELPRNRVADLAAWSAFLNLTRYHASDQLFDVQEYLSKSTYYSAGKCG